MTPVPFEITTTEQGTSATNGKNTLTVGPEIQAQVKRRRAIKIPQAQSSTDSVLPLLNQLAGDLLANPEMDRDVVKGRLDAIKEKITPPPQVRVEWVVAVIGDLRVYFNGEHVVVSNQDLWP